MSRLILFTLLLLTSITTYGRRPIDSYFVTAPKQLLPHLSENSRKDLIDLHDAGHESRVKHPLGGTVEIISLDDRQITVQLSSASSLQIALLPVADTTGIIAVIENVSLPARDSRLSFYDTQWQPIPTERVFTAPTPETFMDKGSKRERRQAAGLIDLLPLSYTIEGDTLLARESLQEYLPEEVYNRIASLLRKEPVTYTWNGKRFTR